MNIKHRTKNNKQRNRDVYLSVVIPAYNEIENLKLGVLEAVYKYLSKQVYSWELLLINDASTDKTLNFLIKFANKKPQVRVLNESHRGKGGTVIAGVLAAKGEIVLFTDMDQATPIDQIEKLLPHFKHDDIVIGSRSGREGAPLVRKAMASGFSILRTLILRLPYKDTQCGFKAFKYDAAKKIFERLRIYKEKSDKGASVNAGFDLEILYVARKMGFSVEEVSVEWHHKGTERVSAIRDSWQAFLDLLRVRVNALKGQYKV